MLALKWEGAPLTSVVRKRPIRDSTDSDDYKRFDASLAAVTHFCALAGVIKNLRTNVIASRCFPAVSGGGGFASLDFLRGEMFSRPAQPLSAIQSVSVHRTEPG